MGIDAYGIVFFGVKVGIPREDLDWPPESWFPCEDSDEPDWEEVYAQRKGLSPPAQDFSEATADAYREYWGKKHGLLKAEPVSIERMGAWEYGDIVLQIESSEQSVEWGVEPLEVMSQDYCRDTDQESRWREQIVAFAQFMDIPLPENAFIGWQLAAKYF